MKYLFFGLLLGGCGLDSINPSDTGSATFGELSISPSSMDFGFVEPGESAEDTFVIVNQGSDPIALRGLGVVGSSAFQVTATTQVPPTLEKGDELVLNVAFSPDDYEDYEAALALQTDMIGLEYIERPIVGTGLRDSDDGNSEAPLLDLDFKSVNFGEADLEETVSEVVVLQNVSATDVMIQGIEFTKNQFDWESDLSIPYLLKGGESRELTLTFTPNAEKSYTGQARILSNDPNYPEMSVTLKGKGVDLCGICSGVIQVNTGEDPYELGGFLSIFGSEDSKTVTVSNIGDKPLNISAVNVKNDAIAPAGTFKITGLKTPMTLEPNESGSFNVVYSATGEAIEFAVPELDSNVVHILSDDQWEPDYVIKLNGVGL